LTIFAPLIRAARVNLRARLAEETPDVLMTEPIPMELLARPTSEGGAAAILRLVDGLPARSHGPTRKAWFVYDLYEKVFAGDPEHDLTRMRGLPDRARRKCR